ncbi:AraC family transcriptional regulator [Sphingobacterium mizutaii]|uniref:AraC family transcriptional regulator n=1 Tax=Sphingobacterium mizutaii TaxID=1010 RepID=UPI0016266DAA|nr:helix-turn-helix domain-containing protein [Sphingobacterium mizutaii]
MLIFFIYSAIIVICLLSYQIYSNLPEKGLFEKILSLLIITLLIHTVFAALFRDIIPGYKYVDLGAPFGLLYGPFLYFGYLAFKYKRVTGKTILIHGFPFLIMSVIFIIFLSSEFIRFQYGKLYYVVLYSMFGLSWILYPILVLLKGNISDFLQLDTKRLYYYFIILLLVLAAFIIPTIMSSFIDKFDVGKPVSGVTVYLIMMIGVSMIYNYLFRTLVSQVRPQGFPLSNHSFKKNETTEYSLKVNQNVKESPYKEKILQYLEEKRYLSPEFNIDVMARDLKISRPLISQFFKDYFNQNALKTINALRVEEVCKELSKEDFDMNIDELALRCGFSSRASFYRNFNLEKKCTPIEYREMVIPNLN